MYCHPFCRRPFSFINSLWLQVWMVGGIIWWLPSLVLPCYGRSVSGVIVLGDVGNILGSTSLNITGIVKCNTVLCGCGSCSNCGPVSVPPPSKKIVDWARSRSGVLVTTTCLEAVAIDALAPCREAWAAQLPAAREDTGLFVTSWGACAITAFFRGRAWVGTTTLTAVTVVVIVGPIRSSCCRSWRTWVSDLLSNNCWGRGGHQ